MKIGKLISGLLLAAGLAVPALAAPAQGLYGDVGVCDPWYVQSCAAPLGRLVVGASQFGVSIASATAPTVPSGALAVLVIVEGSNSDGGCARWRDDGTAPTASVGVPIGNQRAMWYFAKTSATTSAINPNFQLIAATGETCTVDFLYYK